MALGETLGGVRGYPFSRMVGYLPPAGTGRRELGGSQNINNFTSWAFDRQDRCLAGQLLINRVVINFSQFMVAFSTPDGFHCAYPVIALHRCLDGTVPWLNAGPICGKWLSRMLQHPGRSHCLFMVCFLTKPKRLLGVWQHTCHITRSHPPSSRSTRHSLRPAAPATPCNQPPDYCPAAALAAVTAFLRTRSRSGPGWQSAGTGWFFFAWASSFFSSAICFFSCSDFPI